MSILNIVFIKIEILNSSSYCDVKINFLNKYFWRFYLLYLYLYLIKIFLNQDTFT